MAIKVENIPSTWESRLPFWNQWLSAVALQEGKSLGAFHYRFMTDEELIVMNRQFLDHDTYTDIITFDRSRGSRVSADVAVSWERIRDNASGMGVCEADEVDRVVLHAVLHACGYGDKSEEEELFMRSLEERYLSIRPEGLLHV